MDFLTSFAVMLFIHSLIIEIEHYLNSQRGWLPSAQGTDRVGESGWLTKRGDNDLVH